MIHSPHTYCSGSSGAGFVNVLCFAAQHARRNSIEGKGGVQAG